MLSKRLKIARNKTKLTQDELAKKVNTTKATISNYENGHSTPSNEMVVLLAGVLNTTTDFLLGHDTNKLLENEDEKEEAEFQAFKNDPTLQKWYKELPKSEEEDLQKLRTIWEMIKNDVNK